MMTREEAIRIATGLRTDFKCESDTMVDFCNTVIKALEQEPCEDAISRQAVLDAMSETWKHICYVARRRKPTKSEEAVYSDMVGTIKLLPSVNPQPCDDAISRQWLMECVNEGWIKFDTEKDRNRFIHLVRDIAPQPKMGHWISVSERLPEVGKKILVTSYGRVCYAVMISIDGRDGYPIFRLQDSLKERTVCETIAHSDMTSSRIRAWMPLPEPYKPD